MYSHSCIHECVHANTHEHTHTQVMAAQRRQVAAEGRQNHHPAQAAMREAEARVAHYFLLREGGGGALTARALAFVATVSGECALL